MLKQKTIINEFKKRGWKWCDESGGFLYYEHYSTRIFGKFDGLLLRLYEARLWEHGNFHIESYWSLTSMKKLREDLDIIERVYGNLCKIRFKKEGSL